MHGCLLSPLQQFFRNWCCEVTRTSRQRNMQSSPDSAGIHITDCAKRVPFSTPSLNYYLLIFILGTLTNGFVRRSFRAKYVFFSVSLWTVWTIASLRPLKLVIHIFLFLHHPKSIHIAARARHGAVAKSASIARATDGIPTEKG